MTPNETAYIAQFDSLDAAIDFENSALSVGDEFLPEASRAVRDQVASTEQSEKHFGWLIDQLNESR